MNRKELASERLIELLGDPDWDVREMAASELFAKGRAALDAITVGLTHSEWQVRAGCAALMDHLADDRCIDPLCRALNDPSLHVRRHAVHSLGCQGCKIAPLQVDIVGLLIERIQKDDSIRVRRVAVHQLGLQKYDKRAVGALQAILSRDTDTKLLSRARFALQNHLKQSKTSDVSASP